MAVHEEVRRLNETTSEKWTVDHIIPLNAKWVVIDGVRVRIVQGLELAWNMQPLTRKANREKGNSFDPEQAAREQMTWLRDRGLAAL